MKEIHSNITIIGGGLIGAACALSLSGLGSKVSIIEKQTKKKIISKKADTRTVAISEGTKKIFQKLDIWQKIERFAEPIKRIKIIDRKLSNSVDFDNKRRNSNLGYIVENNKLLDILYKNIYEKNNIRFFNNSTIKNISNTSEKIITTTNNTKVISDLNIAADGKKSFVRSFYKATMFKKNYNKKALVLNISHSYNHNNTAYEFFYKNGPLAILPMKMKQNNYFSSIVWTNNSNYLDHVIRLNKNDIISILNEKTKNTIGDISNILSMQLFPVTAHINSNFYNTRLIYIGDSAHSIHPIAGQGWNLGMNDVETLYAISKKYKSLGIELGSRSFCKDYHNNTFYKAYRMYQLTDKLDNLFQQQNYLFFLFRSIGLGLIQRNKKIKNLISDFAMGIN